MDQKNSFPYIEVIIKINKLANSSIQWTKVNYQKCCLWLANVYINTYLMIRWQRSHKNIDDIS